MDHVRTIESSKPNLLIIGGGAVTTEYYLPALDMLGWLSHTIIIDTSITNLEKIRTQYTQVRIQQIDFRHFFKGAITTHTLDAAIIALPNWLHEEASVLALDKGLHVLCEKPLALTQSACLRLEAHAKKNKRILAVGMVRRLLPSVSALREALQKKLVGEIISVDIEDGTPYTWLSNSGAFFRGENGGVLADMGVHYLDLVEHLVGKLTPLRYQDDYAGGVEANAEYHLETQAQIPVHLTVSRTHYLRNTTIFHCEHGQLILEKDTFSYCYCYFQDSALTAKLESTTPFVNLDWDLSFQSCFAEQFVQFARAIQNQSSSYVDVHCAAATVSLIEWAYYTRQTTKATFTTSSLVAERPILPVAPAVVTGGTGFIGSNLVERLNEIGLTQIHVPVRNYRTCANVSRFPVTLSTVDLLDYQQVLQLLHGTHYVFHLAYGKDGTQGPRITIEGTKNVIEAAIEANVECVVVLSTMYVFGHPNTNALVDETWPYAPAGGEYGKSKMKMEQWCLKRASTSPHTRIVILNPSCVYGPGGKTYSQMPVEMARQGAFCWINEGSGAANYTYVDNLIDAMVLAATCEKAHGERLIINDGATTWYRFLEPVLGPLSQQPSYTIEELRKLNRPSWQPGLSDVIKAIIMAPTVREVVRNTFYVRFARALEKRFALGFLKDVQSKPRVSTQEKTRQNEIRAIPPDWLGDLFGDTATSFSAKKAESILGWKPLIPLEVGHELTRQWLESIRIL